jgi:hypothetical protein
MNVTANQHGGRALALAEPQGSETHARRIDRAAVQRAARDLLRAVGADVEGDALKETPQRLGRNRSQQARVAVDERRLANPDVPLGELGPLEKEGVA